MIPSVIFQRVSAKYESPLYPLYARDSYTPVTTVLNASLVKAYERIRSSVRYSSNAAVTTLLLKQVYFETSHRHTGEQYRSIGAKVGTSLLKQVYFFTEHTHSGEQYTNAVVVQGSSLVQVYFPIQYTHTKVDDVYTSNVRALDCQLTKDL